MEKFRNVYEVTVKRGEQDAFVLLNLGEDGYTDFVDHDEDLNEVHAIFTDRDLDRELDVREQVLSWTVSDSYGN